MHSKDIAWLAIASVMGFKLATGLAVAGGPAFQAPASHTTALTVSQGEDARQACREGVGG